MSERECSTRPACGDGSLDARHAPARGGLRHVALRDRTLGEDVVHDCYVRLLEKADTYNLLRDGTKLFYKAITHACVDRNYRDRRLLSLEAELDGEAEGTKPVADASRPMIRTTWRRAASWKTR